MNYKLWAIIFGIFIAAIVGLSIWASFHWGVGMGTIGVRPVNPEDAAAGATEAAVEYATDGDVVTLTKKPARAKLRKQRPSPMPRMRRALSKEL